MYIVSKERNAIINMDTITNIFIGANGCGVNAEFTNGKGCRIGRYNTEKEAEIAISMIAEKIGKADVVFMPGDEAIKAEIITERQGQHHISGKKTKGHGGS